MSAIAREKKGWKVSGKTKKEKKKKLRFGRGGGVERGGGE